MRRSKILERLRADKPALLTNISLSPSPLAVEMAGRIGIDGVWIDTEHRPFVQREVSHIIAGARLGDIDAMVRIRKGEGYSSFFRPLEDGAAGIMVPHVATREETEWVVRNSKYPPTGRRGLENVMPDADLSFADTLDYMAHANRETFVAIQIEDVEALDVLDEMFAVPDWEIAFIGPADLTASMGIALQREHPRFIEAVQNIADAAARHGKWWGLPVVDAETAAKYAEQGARFFNISGDFTFLKEGFQKVRDDFDRVFPE